MAADRRVTCDVLASEKLHEIEVIVLGLSRTGTMCKSLLIVHTEFLQRTDSPSAIENIFNGFSIAMHNALNTLGYKSYHMSEATRNHADGHLVMWSQAINAKYGTRPGLKSDASSTLTSDASTDFTEILKDYNAVTDAPTVLFPSELLGAHPNARLILTTHPRGVEAWLCSMQNSYFRIASWKIWSVLMHYDTVFSRPYITLLRRIVEVWTETPWHVAKGFAPVEAKLRAFYAEHNDRMRKLAKSQGRGLLEFHPSQGWEPLCDFLGKDVPSEPYPHWNEGDYVVTLHRNLVVKRLKATFSPVAATAVIGVVAFGFASWWWKWR